MPSRDSKTALVEAAARNTCGAKTKKGKGPPCTRPAGWGTAHVGYGTCKLHGGSTPNANKHAAKLMATEELMTYGEPRDIEPHDALLEELHRTAGHVAWLQMIVGALEQDDLHGPVGTEGFGHDDEGNALMHHPRHEPHVWIKLYQEERQHFVRIAKACVDVGIDERRVALAEKQGQLMAQAIEGILGGLKLTAVQKKRAPAIVREQLTTISGTAEEIT